MNTKRAEVLVVGAGPVGLVTAIALTRLGIQVRILDRAPETKRQPRAAVIWSRAAEALDALGVLGPIRERAVALRSMQVYARGHRLGGMDVGHVASAHAHPLVIEQHDVERLLAADLTELGVGVEWDTAAVEIVPRSDGVRVHTRGPGKGHEVAEYDWVIGCEGTTSIVREAAGIAYEGRWRRDLQVVQANAIPTWRHPDDPGLGYFFLNARHSLGCFPVPGGGYRFFCFTHDPDPERRDPPTPAEMRDLVSRLTGDPGVRLELTEPRWLSRARFADRVAVTLHRGRVLLAGDAAHAWAPIGGHGMNTGIRGAHNLAWKLAAVQKGHAPTALLDTYSTEQIATARAVMREMRFNILELPLPPSALTAATVALRGALATPHIRGTVEHGLSDLGKHHRRSALSWQRLRATGPRAGDRLPDVEVLVDGTRARLHKLLRYDRWTLLVPDTPGDIDAPRRALGISDTWSTPVSVHRFRPAPGTKAGPGAGITLVRPDGHIGLRAMSSDTGTLQAYGHTFFDVRQSAAG